MISINNKKFQNVFEFDYADSEEVAGEINELDPKKTTTGISITMRKNLRSYFTGYLSNS